MSEIEETQTETPVENPFVFDPSDIQEGKLFGKYGSLEELKDALLSPKPPVDPAPEADAADEAVIPTEGLAIPEVATPESTGLSQEDLAPLYEEFAKEGKLSDASYAALEAKGLPRALVDGYVQGQQALIESRANSVYKAVGGKEVVEKALTWAAKNLSKAEQDAYNQATASAPPEMVALLLQGIITKAGIQTTSIAGRASQSLSATPYANQSEFQAALNDDRYGRDVAYTNEVHKRAKAAQTVGNI